MSNDNPVPVKPLPGLPAPESLQLRISKMIMKEFPQLIVADPEASGAACTELAAVMGAIMAPIIVRKGMVNYREALRHLVTMIDQSAKATAMRAAEIHSNRMEPESKH